MAQTRDLVRTLEDQEKAIKSLKGTLARVGGGGGTLDDLSDVTITTIASGEILKWAGSEWVNNTLAEAGISATGHSHLEADITDLGNYSLTGHTHTESDITDLGDYLPLSGGTMTGNIDLNTLEVLWTGYDSATRDIGLVSDQGLSMELGRVDGTTATPFIDFHTGSDVDYTARILATGNNATAIEQGGLTIIAKGTGVTLDNSDLMPSGSVNLGGSTAGNRFENLYLVVADAGGASATEGRVHWSNNDWLSYVDTDNEWHFVADGTHRATIEQHRTFTPVLQGTTTDPTLGTGGVQDGHYVLAGGMCHVWINWKFGTSGWNAGSGNYYLAIGAESAIPNPTSGFGTGDFMAIGSWRVKGSASGTRYGGTVYMDSNNDCYMERDAQSQLVDHNSPFAFDGSDVVSMAISYPILG